eukprot:5616623-Pyramimonas_sp.AAC.1
MSSIVSQKSSGSYIQLQFACPEAPVNSWRCTCPSTAEHEPDWHGHDQQHSEWRAQATATFTVRCLDQVDKPNPFRSVRKDTKLSAFTRAG